MNLFLSCEVMEMYNFTERGHLKKKKNAWSARQVGIFWVFNKSLMQRKLFESSPDWCKCYVQVFSAWFPLSIRVLTVTNYWLSWPVRGYTWLQAKNVSFYPHGNGNFGLVVEGQIFFSHKFLNHWTIGWCTNLWYARN